MKYGFIGHFPNSIAIADQIGAHGLPLQIKSLATQTVDMAMAPIRYAGMDVCQISAFSYNPLNPNQQFQMEQECLLKKVIPLLSRVGCPYVIINSGNYHVSGFLRGHADNFTDQALDELAKALEKPLTLAEEYGAKILIEPMVHCAVGTPERFLSLKKRLKSESLRINLDIYNFFILSDIYNPIPAIERICGALAGYYDLVHCKDINVTDGVHIHVDETPLGTGVMDWYRAMSFIAQDLPKDGWFIYEPVKSAGDAHVGDKILRQISVNVNINLGRTKRQKAINKS